MSRGGHFISSERVSAVVPRAEGPSGAGDQTPARRHRPGQLAEPRHPAGPQQLPAAGAALTGQAAAREGSVIGGSQGVPARARVIASATLRPWLRAEIR